VNRLVVDASAIGELIVEKTRKAPLFEILQAGDTELHVPALCDVELTSALIRLNRRRLISVDRVSALLEDYLELPIERHGHQGLLQRAMELGDNFTPYDAVYVALSERLDAPLLTADSRLARAARAHTEITVLPP
jgi:predicted nucleic acid-binding protein